jgi:flagellum-specific peptidoglycan hydrolase FlgJ
MKDRLYNILIANGFAWQQARLIVAQAAHETAGFTSPVFLTNNNPFGMKEAKVRQTTARGTRLGHAWYNSIEEAVQDYKLWWQYNRMLSFYGSAEVFANVLKTKGYYEASISEYVKGMNYWFNLYWNGAE